MRTFFLISFLLFGKFLFPQDTSVTWLNNIDTSRFQFYSDKKEIPKEFYPVIGIKNDKDIASTNEDFQEGCVAYDGLPRAHLNWLAADKNNHWVLSISRGGYVFETRYYYIDKEKGKINSNCFSFFGSRNFYDLTFGQTIPKLKARQFYRCR